MKTNFCRTLPIVFILLANLAQPFDARAQTAAVTPMFTLLRRSAHKPPQGQSGDVLVAANLEKDELARCTAEILNDPQSFPYAVLRLRQLVLNYLRRQGQTIPDEPTYLFLSDREGGFPAQDFWLEMPDGSLVEKRGVAFVDMSFDESDLDGERWGSFAEIFAHELGHIILRDLAGKPRQKVSNAIHFVTVRTDPWYAFDEGWGEHFQPVALDQSHNTNMAAQRETPWPSAESGWYARFASEQERGCFFCPANLSFLLWQGRNEQQLRDSAVRADLFAHQVVLPKALRSDNRAYYDAMLYRDILPPKANAPLKNGAQMLASEGVIASLFYRIVSEPRLQGTLREAEFYAQFGIDAPRTPLENIYLKLFAVFANDLHWDIPSGRSPAVQVVSGYARRFPDEAAIVYDIFLEVTHGLTVASPGADLSILRQKLLNGATQLDDNLGPQLWLLNPDYNGGFGIFRYFPLHMPYSFDLNAADATDLRSVSGIDAALAERILSTREAQGYFHSLDDLSQIEGVSSALVERFRSMQAGMQGQLQETTEDDPALVSLMLGLLKGSYVIAAILQVGAVLLAGAGCYLLLRVLRQIMARTKLAPQRGCLARMLIALARSLGVTFLAIGVSLLLYFGNLPVSIWSMGLLGLLAQSWRFFCARDKAEWVWNLATWGIVWAVIGAMY